MVVDAEAMVGRAEGFGLEVHADAVGHAAVAVGEAQGQAVGVVAAHRGRGYDEQGHGDGYGVVRKPLGTAHREADRHPVALFKGDEPPPGAVAGFHQYIPDESLHRGQPDEPSVEGFEGACAVIAPALDGLQRGPHQVVRHIALRHHLHRRRKPLQPGGELSPERFALRSNCGIELLHDPVGRPLHGAVGVDDAELPGEAVALRAYARD